MEGAGCCSKYNPPCELGVSSPRLFFVCSCSLSVAPAPSRLLGLCLGFSAFSLSFLFFSVFVGFVFFFFCTTYLLSTFLPLRHRSSNELSASASGSFLANGFIIRTIILKNFSQRFISPLAKEFSSVRHGGSPRRRWNNTSTPTRSPRTSPDSHRIFIWCESVDWLVPNPSSRQQAHCSPSLSFSRIFIRFSSTAPGTL